MLVWSSSLSDAALDHPTASQRPAASAPEHPEHRPPLGGMLGRVARDIGEGVYQSSAVSIDKRKDFEKHPEEHWRMLTPGNSPSEPQAFYESLVQALRARPLGRPCLDYALDNLAPLLDKDSMWLEFGVWMGRSLNALSVKSLEL